jgi:hypothetical protein
MKVGDRVRRKVEYKTSYLGDAIYIVVRYDETKNTIWLEPSIAWDAAKFDLVLPKEEVVNSYELY